MYWIRVYGVFVGIRIVIARAIGPLFFPAWYLAPKANRDRWARIAGAQYYDNDDTPECPCDYDEYSSCPCNHDEEAS